MPIKLKNRWKPFAVIFVVSQLSGCAIAPVSILKTEKIGYSYEGNSQVDLTSPSATIDISIVDNRGNPNPRMIRNARNAYEEEFAGGIQAELPLADIIKNAISQGLVASHAHVVENSGLLSIVGELEDYDYVFDPGFWSGTVYSRLTIKLKLKDEMTDHTLWHRIVIASASYHGSFSPKDGLLFRDTLNNLVAQLLADENFTMLLRQESVH